MIIKSMSRKTSSFGQLVSYMKSEKSDDRFDIYHHCFSRNKDGLVSEFSENAEYLKQRKNGNIMYHDVLSFSVEKGVDRQALKEGLRDAALRYVNERCPQNMAYGCLHDDHENHVHYHLMISSNIKGESKRLRLTRNQLSQIKKEAETQVLTQHPELKQKPVMTAKDKDSQKEKFSVKADEMKRRAGELPERERVLETIKQGMSQSTSMDEFVKYLEEQNHGFYVRGKNFGVEAVQENGKSKKYRFSTLGIHDDFVDFQNGKYVPLDKQESTEKPPQEAEQTKQAQQEPPAEKRSQAQEQEKPSAGEKEKTQGAGAEEYRQSQHRENTEESGLSDVQERWKQEIEKEQNRETENRQRQRGEDDERQR